METRIYEIGKLKNKKIVDSSTVAFASKGERSLHEDAFKLTKSHDPKCHLPH